MPKLIDADKLKKHYAWWGNEDKEIFDTIIDLQSEAVVRCKDCIYQAECAFTEWLGRNGNGFCSCGERREDETD